MGSVLETDWKIIGRSGPTVDGREIDPASLVEAAEAYDANLYTALVWPEHFRWFNMGKIVALRHEANAEGGVDLYARFIPNDYYLQSNAAGQKLFSSMELKPNFRGTGKYYLTGCAATDSPASAATSEIRFSKSEGDLLLGESVSFETHHFNSTQEADEKPPKWFNKLFNKQETDDMSKEALAAVQISLDALTANFEKFSTNSPAKTGSEAEQVVALAAQVESLTSKFAAFENKDKSGSKEATVSVQEFETLQKSLADITIKLTEALEEKPGTPGGKDAGGEDTSVYI